MRHRRKSLLWVGCLACLTWAVHGAQQASPVISEQLPGVERAVSEKDLKELLRDNFEQDLLPWLPEARPQGALTALDFLNLMHEIDTQWPAYRRNFIAIVVIRNNRYTYWAYPTARSWCTRRVKMAGEEFTKYVQSHNLTFPDVMYVMNGYDKPLCAAGNCSAPIFSYGKCWQPASRVPSVPCATPEPPAAKKKAAKRRPGEDAPSLTITELPPDPEVDKAAAAAAAAVLAAKRAAEPSGMSLRQPKSPYDDLLFPVMNHPFDHLISYPWAEQQDVAFMRAGLYAAMAANCSRVALYKLAQSEAARGVLDVGIYQNRHWRIKVKTVPPVPIEAHAQYRFLINTDGQAASWRLAKLLAMSSVILKWRSSHIEYYYRSLRPGVHYEDVDETDVLTKLQGLRQPGQEERLKDMAAQAQRFAFRYLSQLSRAAYARSALSRYHALFKTDDMEVLLSTVPEGAAPNMVDLLRLRRWLLRMAA